MKARNQRDIETLIKNKGVEVEFERVESFIEEANNTGIYPCGGAFNFDNNTQYMYI